MGIAYNFVGTDKSPPQLSTTINSTQMNHRTRLKAIILKGLKTLTLLAATMMFAACNSDDAVFDELDAAIKNKKIYEQQKEEEIEKIRNLLSIEDLSFEQEYNINNRLYEAFRKYKLDSAIHYQKRNLELSIAVGDKLRSMESALRLIPLHTFMGQFIEGRNLMNNINRNELPDTLLTLYYDTNNKYYYHYNLITHLEKYSQLYNLYSDSIILIGDSSSFTYNTSLTYHYIYNKETEKAETLIKKLTQNCIKESSEHAAIVYSRAVLESQKGNIEECKKYLCQSAIYDIKNAIKENASFLALAKICEKEGKTDRAIKYSQYAIDDAIFSNIQSRAAEIYEFYSIINASYKQKLEENNKKLRNAFIFISIIMLILLIALYYLRKQIRRQSLLKEHITSINKRLKKLNNELNEKNEQLSILNNVKEQYIADFFDLCSGYIKKMDDYRLSLNKLLLNKEFEALSKRLKSTDILNKELELLHKNFDTIFLTLYPTFVEDFNNLLIPEKRIVPKNDDGLALEHRIYALMRLGVENSAGMASFLNCSTSTIYNYRTKMRNSALVSKEEFEEKVMKIGNTKDKK